MVYIQIKLEDKAYTKLEAEKTKRKIKGDPPTNEAVINSLIIEHL